jgi:hypothetical protein
MLRSISVTFLFVISLQTFAQNWDSKMDINSFVSFTMDSFETTILDIARDDVFTLYADSSLTKLYPTYNSYADKNSTDTLVSDFRNLRPQWLVKSKNDSIKAFGLLYKGNGFHDDVWIENDGTLYYFWGKDKYYSFIRLLQLGIPKSNLTVRLDTFETSKAALDLQLLFEDALSSIIRKSNDSIIWQAFKDETLTKPIDFGLKDLEQTEEDIVLNPDNPLDPYDIITKSVTTIVIEIHLEDLHFKVIDDAGVFEYTKILKNSKLGGFGGWPSKYTLEISLVPKSFYFGYNTIKNELSKVDEQLFWNFLNANVD